MNILKKNIIVAFIIGLLTQSIITPIIAQQVTLAISPPHLEAIIKPGKSLLIAYTVQNLGDPSVIKVNVLPFVPKDTTGQIIIKPQFEGPIRFSLDNANIALNQPFFMRTKDSQQFLLKIRIPEGAPEGDYYYTFLAETEAPPSIEGITSSRAKVTVGTNILITVTKNGNLQSNGKITTFSVLPHFKLNLFGSTLNIFDSSDTIPILFLINNSGANMIKPQGDILVRNNFGDLEKYDIVPQNILANSQRIVTATESAQINCENSTSVGCTQMTSLLLKGFYIGTYTISANVNFGQGSANLYANTSFVAIPLRLIVALIVVIILSILVIFRLKKKS